MSSAFGSFNATTMTAFHASAFNARGTGNTAVNIRIFSTWSYSFDTTNGVQLPIYLRDDDPYGSQIGEFMTSNQPQPQTGKLYYTASGGHLNHLHRQRQTLHAKDVELTFGGATVGGLGPVIPDVPIVNARLDLNIDYKDISGEDFTSLLLYIKERTTETSSGQVLLPYFQAGFTNAQLIATIPSGSITQHQSLKVNPNSFSTFTLNPGPINGLRGKAFYIFAMTSVEKQGTGSGVVSSGVRLNGTVINNTGNINMYLRLNE